MKYPMSVKIVLFLLGLLFGVAVVIIPGQSSTYNPAEIIIPDAFIPWNKSMEELVVVLDDIYEYDGQPAKWAMCATMSNTMWQMCLQDQNKAAPFTFHFKQERLSGYHAEFPEEKLGHLIHSAKQIYKGGSRGLTKSKTKEFRIYEKEIDGGWLELYMVYDKTAKSVRVQTKYMHGDMPEPVKEEFELPTKEDTQPLDLKDQLKKKAEPIRDGGEEMAFFFPTEKRLKKPLKRLGILILAAG